MRQTSLLAYWSLEEAKVSKSQQLVLTALKQIAPANNRQVSDYSGIPINVVTPRMGELVKKGVVVYAYEGIDPRSHRLTTFLKPRGLYDGE